MSLVMAATAGPASAAAPPPARTLTLSGPVGPIAMDGPLVAAGYGVDGCEPTVLTWNVETGARTRLRGHGDCADGLSDIAVAGTRVAWMSTWLGNADAEDQLFTASLSHPDGRRVMVADRSGSLGDGWLEGSWAGGLVGDGSRLLFGAWETSFEDAANCDPVNEHPTASCQVDVGGARLHVVGGAAEPFLPFAGAHAVSPQAMDSGRTVALVDDGRIAVFGASLGVARVIRPVRQVAGLDCGSSTSGLGSGIVGLRRTRFAFISTSRTLDVYDALTGRLVHGYPVPQAMLPCGAHVDLYYGYAVYAGEHGLHVLKLSTGRDRVVATSASAFTRFQIDAPGLVFATGGHRGALHFLPFSQLRTLVG
jgi:hypothetical protein